MAICPFITKCSAKVSVDQYVKICSNVTADAYKDCPVYQKIASEQRTPTEWSKLLSL